MKGRAESCCPTKLHHKKLARCRRRSTRGRRQARLLPPQADGKEGPGEITGCAARFEPKTVLVVHLEHDLRDLFDGADHHHQGGARCAAGQRCINAAGAASLPPPQRSHTVQPDRRLHSTSGWRLSADANRCVLYACSKAELGSSMLAISSMFRPSVCTRWWW